jgi:hypothetical protein
LREGEIAWVDKSGRKFKSPRQRAAPKAGGWFESINHGWYTVIAVAGYKNMTIRFDNTGEVKSGVYTHVCGTGKVSDPSVGRIKPITLAMPVGSKYESKKYGKFEIVENLGAASIMIRWEDTANTQEVTAQQILDGRLIDQQAYSVQYPEDVFKPRGHYVYVAKAGEVVVHVGKSFGRRYLHCLSGRSTNYELNRLHFAGEKVSVEIYRDGLNHEGALKPEREMILELQPTGNVVLPKEYEFDLDAIAVQ